MNFYDPSAENGRQVTRAVWNATITGLAAPGVTFVSAYYVLDTVRRVTQSGSLNSPGNLTEEETEAGEIRDREFPGREGCCHTGLAGPVSFLRKRPSATGRHFLSWEVV